MICLMMLIAIAQIMLIAIAKYLWFPDGKDMSMNGALRRVAKAFTDANREAKPLVWNHG